VRYGQSHSGSLDVVVRDFAGQPAAVPELVDALIGHHTDYLRGWPSSPPRWPAAAPRQSIDRWLEELDPLVVADTLFGRLAIVGWCLLDQDVATAAERSGLLGGLTAEIRPRASDFLTSTGLQLLRRRSPMVALSIGALPESLNLATVTGGRPPNRLAIGRVVDVGNSTVNRWAASCDGQVYVGSGTNSSPIFPEESSVGVAAMGWSRTGVLHAALGLGSGLARYDPRTEQLDIDSAWPALSVAAVSEDGIAGETDTTGSLVWGGLDSSSPVELPPIGPLTVAGVALSGNTVVAAEANRLLIGGPDGQWTERPFFKREESLCVAVNDDDIILGLRSGAVQFVPRGNEGIDPAVQTADPGLPREVLALPGKPVSFISAAGRLTAAASEDHVAVLDGTDLVMRWRAPEGTTVSAIALGPDGRMLAVAGRLLLRVWRIDAAGELRLTSYAADTPDGQDELSIQPVVDALAALVVARVVQPPLSLGLFGAWGSGKTFFMRRLESRVAGLCAESRRSGRQQELLWGWRNIRQVRFNAWNYAAADVWAGLLEELIGELVRPQLDDSPIELPPELATLSQGRVQRLTEATADAGNAADAVAAARESLAVAHDKAKAEADNLDRAADAVAKVRRGRVRAMLTDSTLTGVDQALDDANLPPLGPTFERTWQDLDAARRAANSVTGYLRGGGSPALIAAVVLGPVITLVVLGLLDAFNVQAAAIYPWSRVRSRRRPPSPVGWRRPPELSRPGSAPSMQPRARRGWPRTRLSSP